MDYTWKEPFAAVECPEYDIEFLPSKPDQSFRDVQNPTGCIYILIRVLVLLDKKAKNRIQNRIKE